MLRITNRFGKNDVVIIRLLSGEEIIAKVNSANNEGVEITKPLVLGLMQNPNTNQPVVGLAPFVFGIDDSEPIVIESSKWTFIAMARKEAKDQYVKATSSLEIVGANTLPTNISDLADMAKKMK